MIDIYGSYLKTSCRDLPGTYQKTRNQGWMLAGSVVPPMPIVLGVQHRHTRFSSIFSDIPGTSLSQTLLLISVEWFLRSSHIFPFLPRYVFPSTLQLPE